MLKVYRRGQDGRPLEIGEYDPVTRKGPEQFRVMFEDMTEAQILQRHQNGSYFWVRRAGPLEFFDPRQPRDKYGRWSSGGGAGGGGITGPEWLTQDEPGSLHQRVINDGGFTYDPIENDSPTSGFVVSIYPEAEFSRKIDEITPDVIGEYVTKNQKLLEEPEAMLGGWYDEENGLVYLDVSVVTQDKNRAIELAKEYNQEAIFDLSTFETIVTKSESERRTAATGELAAFLAQLVRLGHLTAGQAIELYDPRQPRDKYGRFSAAGSAFYRPSPSAQGAGYARFRETGDRGAGPPWVQPEDDPASMTPEQIARRDRMALRDELLAGQQVLPGTEEQVRGEIDAVVARKPKSVEDEVEELRYAEYTRISGDPHPSGEGAHSSTTEIVELDDGTPCVLKNNHEYFGWSNGEEASYVIASEVIGNPDLVPPSAAIDSNLSIQHMLEDGATGEGAYHEWGYDVPEIDRESFQDMVMLDIVTGNGDRHIGNVWIHESGRVSAIDNDSAFFSENASYNQGYAWGERFHGYPSDSGMKDYYTGVLDEINSDNDWSFELDRPRLNQLSELKNDARLKEIVGQYGGDYVAMQLRIERALRDHGYV